MNDPFLAEIRIFSGPYAPQGWAFCNGQTLPIKQYTALYSLLGTTYGGNATSTFGLPNLQASAPLQAGQAPGASNYPLGQAGGAATVAINVPQMPSHLHTPQGASSVGTQDSPENGIWALPSVGRGIHAYDPGAGSGPTMATGALQTTGSGQAHDNLMPYVVLNYCIALQGVYPSRP